MYETSRPLSTQNPQRSRESKTPAPTTDSLDLSNYCPSDLILKRIYLRVARTPMQRSPREVLQLAVLAVQAMG